MTIKELENRTGMPRANIRFYEGEGLLAPKRLANGYRDYTEEDVGTLEKIRLLRQLQLDLDTIGRVQRGELTLAQALFVQQTRLEGDRVLIQRAAEVCRALEASGVEYGALDPEPYLREREAPPAPALPQPPPAPAAEEERAQEPRACWHPWQRWLARALDMSLYGTAIDLVWLVAFRNWGVPLATGLFGWLLNVMLLAFTLAVEPLWLHFWGWTPGKWVFGLKLRDVNGEKLTLAQGFQRGYVLAWEGYGLNIPLWSLWRMWQCRKLGLEGRDCGWDSEEGFRYTKEERRFSGWCFAGACLLCALALTAGFRYSQTPPNQGVLTVEGFCENYNYYLKQLTDVDLPTLSGTGRWVERERVDGVVYVFGETSTWDEPEFTLSGDRVLAVKLRLESEDPVVASGTREQLALLAMTGALDGLNLFNYDLKGWLRAYEEQASAWVDADFTCRGLRITQRVDFEGYSGWGDQLWSTNNDAPRHCEKTLVISLAEP